MNPPPRWGIRFVSNWRRRPARSSIGHQFRRSGGCFTGKESGVDVSMQVLNICTIRDAKIVRVEGGYRDRAEALEAAGLPAQDAHAES
jgi:hypothetical protein